MARRMLDYFGEESRWAGAVPRVGAERRRKRWLVKGTGLLRADLERLALGALQGALHRANYST